MSLEPVIQYLYHHKEKSAAVSLLETMHRHAFSFEEYDDLSKCAFRIKEYQLAIEYGEEALTTAYANEKMWAARTNLINVYNHANYPEKALRLIRANEVTIPNDADTRLEKAFSLYLLGRRDEAEALLRKELERDDLTEEVRTKIVFNLGTYELYRDNFNKGLTLFLIEGQTLNFWKKPTLPGELWDGQEAPGRSILVYAEAGIGDEIINVRFLKHLQRRGLKPTWYTDRPDMANIFRASGFEVITQMKHRPPGSLWTHSMAVPTYLKLDHPDLWDGPYLKTVPEFDEKWRKEITQKPRLKVGLRWQGNPEYDHDLHRSVPLDMIMSALPSPRDDKLALYSLQRDTGLEELETHCDVVDLSSRLVTFEDTLSAINLLDVIITSCTSIAHAAAALGKRTYIFAPLSAYYTWSHSMKQSPWYGDNVTLLRQVRPRVWDEPIAELKELLASREL